MTEQNLEDGVPVWVVRLSLPPARRLRTLRVAAGTSDRARLHVLQEYPRHRVDSVLPEPVE